MRLKKSELLKLIEEEIHCSIEGFTHQCEIHNGHISDASNRAAERVLEVIENVKPWSENWECEDD